MPDLKASQTRALHYLPQLELVVIGLLAAVVQLLFRVPTSRWVPALWFESFFLLAIPPLALWGVSKWMPPTPNELLPSQRTKLSVWLQAGGILFVGIVLLTQYVCRLSGLGDATEIVFMMVLQYAAWYLIVFSSFQPSFRKMGFVACCALVLFTCFMSEHFDVFIASFLFAVCALWQLLSNYWSRLNSKALEGNSKMLPVNSIAIGVTLLAIVCTSAIVGAVVPQNMTISLSGFSPFSGGDRGYQDIFARSGIGDGDMVTAGQNASSSAPVESDQFIEDNKPSIYDVSSDTFHDPAPIKKKDPTRAVSLQVKTKHVEKVIESEQAGQSFRTARKPPSDRTLEMEDRISKALFFVEGSTPVRFSIDCFQHFDGWDWSKVDLDKKEFPESKINLSTRYGKPWYRKLYQQEDYLTASRAHRVKLLRLSTKALPAPPLLKAWHIDRVDLPNLFKFNAHGSVVMAGGIIPSHTVIDNISDVPNFHVLSGRKKCQLTNPDSPLTQIPDNESKSRIKQLANSLIEGYPKGWQQIEAIIGHFRSEFTYDPTLVATDDSADSVEAFLDQQGGPAYQFASAATLALRAAGYNTRLRRGFLVQSKDYDRVAGQSVVTSKNLHMWPEVTVDGWNWIPVEPTPGFPIPYNHLNWWQWCQSQVASGIYWVKHNPITSLLTLLLAGFLFRFRWEITAYLSWLVWYFVFRLFPSQRLKATRKLIDVRFWAAGSPRPRFVAISDWFSQPAPQAAQKFCHLWQIENFSLTQKPLLRKKQVELACQQIVGDLSFQCIKSHNGTELNQ